MFARLFGFLLFVALCAAPAQAGNVFPPDGPCSVGDNIVYAGDGFKCQKGSAVPSGTIAFFALAACPSGWAMANGANGTVDLRGHFLRAWDAGRGVDPGRGLGTMQGDAIRNITGSVSLMHGGPSGFSGAFASSGSYSYSWWDGSAFRGYDNYFSFDASRMVPTAAENRPVNIALLACQKL